MSPDRARSMAMPAVQAPGQVALLLPLEAGSSAEP